MEVHYCDLNSAMCTCSSGMTTVKTHSKLAKCKFYLWDKRSKILLMYTLTKRQLFYSRCTVNTVEFKDLWHWKYLQVGVICRKTWWVTFQCLISPDFCPVTDPLFCSSNFSILVKRSLIEIANSINTHRLSIFNTLWFCIRFQASTVSSFLLDLVGWLTWGVKRQAIQRKNIFS